MTPRERMHFAKLTYSLSDCACDEPSDAVDDDRLLWVAVVPTCAT
jgi:hypothetical protein